MITAELSNEQEFVELRLFAVKNIGRISNLNPLLEKTGCPE